MTWRQQLDSWVNGRSIHNPTRNECCPDFSCCQPSLRWPRPKRRRFAAANDDTRARMLAGSLASLLRARGHSVETSDGAIKKAIRKRGRR